MFYSSRCRAWIILLPWILHMIVYVWIGNSIWPLVIQFSWTILDIWLPILLFWESIVVRELFESNMSRIKSFSKYGLLKEGAWSIVVFMSLKETFSIYVHLYCTLCFTICYKGFTICMKSGTNLRTKLIVPINDFIAF